jgi:hypothetical protein
MSDAPELRCYMNLMALGTSVGEAAFEQSLDRLSAAGFQGVQFAQPGTAAELAACRNRNMGIAASGRVNNRMEAFALAEQVAGDGYECVTVHAGWGLEDDPEAFDLIEGILTAASRWRMPIYIETHRATICQDMWRTVQFIRRFPEMRFNGDFSHWYTGQEMVYGGFARKLEFIQPVLDRVRFIHGRIANPGCIQVAIPDDDSPEPEYVQHFRQLWTAAFQGFIASGESSSICFAPELLAADIYYARTFQGVEESDRFAQSLLLNRIARQCFACAKAS